MRCCQLRLSVTRKERGCPHVRRWPMPPRRGPKQRWPLLTAVLEWISRSDLPFCGYFSRSINGGTTARPAVGAENQCHQAILMNHATGAITSLNPELVKVGDVVGERAQRRGLLQGAVRPVGVVEVFVLSQHGHKVPLVPYQGPVEQFAAAAADPPFHDRVHSG